MCTTHILPLGSLRLAPLVIIICLVDTVITQWIHLCDSARDLLSNSYLYTLKTTDFLVVLSSFWPDCNSKHKVFASGAVEWLLSMFSHSVSWVSTSPIKTEWVKLVLSICHSVYMLRNCGCWNLSGVWVGFDDLSSKQHATIQEKWEAERLSLVVSDCEASDFSLQASCVLLYLLLAVWKLCRDFLRLYNAWAVCYAWIWTDSTICHNTHVNLF